MKPYSQDLRERIVHAREAGQTERHVAQRFGVSLSSVQRYARQKRQSGSLTPKPGTGRVPTIKKEQEPELVRLVQTRTDWTLGNLAQAWEEETGVRPTASALHRALHRIGCTYKKRAASPPKGTRTNAKRSESR